MTSFSVPDMTCNHCKATIEKALSAVPQSGPIMSIWNGTS